MNPIDQKNVLIRIVDDETPFREALKFLLEVEGWQVASYACAEEFLAEDAPSRSGCLILDVSMPTMNGLELHEVLRERKNNIPVIFLTAHGDLDMAVQELKKGAYDFIQKPINEERLLGAVEEAVTWDLSHRGWSIDPREEAERYASLTPREKEIIGFVAAGLTTRQIAERLSLSERTVEVHRSGACRKLKLQQPADIARLLEHLDAN